MPLLQHERCKANRYTKSTRYCHIKAQTRKYHSQKCRPKKTKHLKCTPLLLAPGSSSILVIAAPSGPVVSRRADMPPLLRARAPTTNRSTSRRGSNRGTCIPASTWVPVPAAPRPVHARARLSHLCPAGSNSACCCIAWRTSGGGMTGWPFFWVWLWNCGLPCPPPLPLCQTRFCCCC